MVFIQHVNQENIDYSVQIIRNVTSAAVRHISQVHAQTLNLLSCNQLTEYSMPLKLSIKLLKC